MTTVGTIEDFWSVYHYIDGPAKLRSGCDYHLFKEGITPMWEDPANKEGGRWLYNMVSPFLGFKSFPILYELIEVIS